jgi:formiminoglutamate deiminase
VIQAAHEAGVRLTLLDTCYLHGGIGADPQPTQLRFSDGTAEAWAERVDQLRSVEPTVRIGAALHSVRAVDPDSAATVAKWAAGRQARLHAHVSEQPAENQDCLDAYGATPTELLADAGALSERFTAVHATHVSSRDIALLGEARARCCLCPTTERDLADGVGPAGRLRQEGVELALGSDSQAIIEPFEEARAVELDERLVTGIRGRHPASELLRAATQGGYESLGWTEGGAIRAGALADLVAVRLDSVRLAGAPAADVIDELIFAGAASDIGDVLVGGRFVVRDGVHMLLDVPEELRAAIGSIPA